MPSDDPIILNPPPKKDPGKDDDDKKRSAPAPVSLIPQGIQSLKTVLKQYSTWALAAILAAPELYQAASMLGMLSDAEMPSVLMVAIRSVAGIGLVAKFIKQQKPV